MYNISPHYKLMLKHKQRPFSNIDKTFQHPSNKTFNEDKIKAFNAKINKEEKNPKKYYLNLSYRKNALEQKKLFYNKIYNRNYGNKDSLGLTNFLSIKKEKRGKTNIKTKDNSTSIFSSTAPFRKINLKSKNLQKTQEDFKIYEYSFEKDKIKENTDSYLGKINNTNKIDEIMQINDEEFKKVSNSNTISKRRPISVSMLLNREKIIQKKIEIKPEEVNSEQMKTKNIFIIKFGYILDLFKKALSGSDWVRMEFRTTYTNITTNLSKSFESFNKILLNLISDENCLQSLFSFCEEILSWQKLAIEEIRHWKKEYIHLNKRQKILEEQLKIKKDELKKINEDIIKYDLNKVNKGKLDENKVEKIKKDFNQVESNYVNTIYQLNLEKAQLNLILEQNKKEKINNDELKKKIRNLREELAECKTLIIKDEFNQKNKDKMNNIYIDELSEKIDGFEKEKNIWKEKENKLSEEIINLKIKIDRTNEIIKEKDNKILELEKKIEENKINPLLGNNIKIPASTQFINENRLK